MIKIYFFSEGVEYVLCDNCTDIPDDGEIEGVEEAEPDDECEVCGKRNTSQATSGSEASKNVIS